MIMLAHDDSIHCDSQRLKIEHQGKPAEFVLSLVEKLSILTTDRGPFEDDMALAVFVFEEVFLLPSQHPLYEQLLFDQLGKVFPLNYSAITAASASCDPAEFVIFTR